MIILDTVAHETIWGGQKLVPYAKEKKEKIGHLYSLCCEKGLENHILNGKYKGKTFQEYFVDVRDMYGLGKYEEFPLIIALVEANDNLSIQVHPDDLVAKEEEGAAYGKNESWFFLEAPESGAIFNGCLAENNEQVEKKMREDDLMSVVDQLPVGAGDYVYVEAGTLHALSAGSFLYEIEENSPWTYRMFDYRRVDDKGNPRELHIEKAMKALKTDLKSKAEVLGKEKKEERRYILQKLEDALEYKNTSNTLQCVTFIKGECLAEDCQVTVGTTVVLEPGEVLQGDIQLAMVAQPK